MLLDKCVNRFSEAFYLSVRFRDSHKRAYNIWLNQFAVSLEEFGHELGVDYDLKCKPTVENIREDGRKLLENLPKDYGGAALLEFLAVLTMHVNPKVVVETGVGLGYSSRLFLVCFDDLEKSILFSSELPYPGIDNSEAISGSLVPQNLRKNWYFLKDGDQRNLVAFRDQLSGKVIDLVHYDSDKTMRGRRRFFRSIQKYLKVGTWVIMDDIQDNDYFYELVMLMKPQRIFTFQHKGSLPAGAFQI